MRFEPPPSREQPRAAGWWLQGLACAAPGVIYLGSPLELWPDGLFAWTLVSCLMTLGQVLRLRQPTRLAA